MLACLALRGEAGLKLTGNRVHDEDTCISLCGATNHVRHKVFVAGRVEQMKQRALGAERVVRYINRHAMCPFFLR